MSYTKLFQTIITSTIWTEDDKTRIVWVTLLALADKNGEVMATLPGLARLAGVSIDATEDAVARFLSPDKYSRTPDDEGRRIEEIDGGWALLNHGKYRLMASKDENKTKNAERQKRHRERQKRNATVTDSNATVTQSNATVTQSNAKVTHDRDIAEAEADTEVEEETKTTSNSTSDSAPVASDETKAFLQELWSLSIQRTRTSKQKVAAAWRKIPTKHKPQFAAVLDAYRAWLRCEAWTKDGGQFVCGLHVWVNDRQWENIPEPARTPSSSFGNIQLD